MPKPSAGILLYRRRPNAVEFLLVHPGGPYWRTREIGVWSIPKGEIETDQDPLAVALREFHEETGHRLDAELTPLEPIVQKGGKVVRVWAAEGDLDINAITSNTFTAEWPPRSGRFQEFPEVDRAGWFTAAAAREKIIPAQFDLIVQLRALLELSGP